MIRNRKPARRPRGIRAGLISVAPHWERRHLAGVFLLLDRGCPSRSAPPAPKTPRFLRHRLSATGQCRHLAGVFLFPRFRHQPTRGLGQAGTARSTFAPSRLGVLARDRFPVFRLPLCRIAQSRPVKVDENNPRMIRNLQKGSLPCRPTPAPTHLGVLASLRETLFAFHFAALPSQGQSRLTKITRA